MANENRQHAFTRPTPGVPEPYRQLVEQALQRFARLIAANTTADAALSNRVTEIEDSPGGVTDHGALTGLGDDDHTQYALAGSATTSRLTQNTSRLLGRTTASSGAIEEITVGSGLSLSAGALTNTAGSSQEQVEDWVAGLLVAGNGIDLTYVDGSGTLTVDVDESELAMQAPQYVTLATTTALPNERVLTPGHGLDLVDAGAGSTVTLDVDETEFATGPGLITPAMLNNGGARTLLGTSGNSAAARADIAGVAHGFAHDNGTSIAFRTFEAAYENDSILYSVDFTTLANNALTGTESLDGRNWTILQEGNSTLFEIVNGTGLHWDASTTSTVYTSTTQSASRMQISWTNLLGSSYDPTGEYLVLIRLGTSTWANGNRLGVHAITNGTTATNNTGAIKRRPSGTVQVAHYGPSATEAAGVNVDPDILAIRVSNNLVVSYYGTYSGGFPTFANLTLIGNGGFAVTSAAAASYLSNGGETAAIVLFMATGEASGTADHIIRELQVRRIR